MSTEEFVMKLRDGLREELDATNTYDELLQCAPAEVKPILEEIKKDEINHQGRLLSLILKLDPSQLDSFNSGLAQEE